jgi:hypothetical protein
MLEYDPNLPQEIGHPKRGKAGLLVLALLLATVLLVYALITLLPVVSRYKL